MFRMAQYNPKLVIGFEPYLQHYYTFKTLNAFAGVEKLHVELLGVEHMALFKSCFDVVFLMGILYHRSSPVDVLREIRTAMNTGGVLIVESQGIPGDEPQALFPKHRYAKVPGTYFVPTCACLANWLMLKFSFHIPCPVRSNDVLSGWFLNHMRILLIHPIQA